MRNISRVWLSAGAVAGVMLCVTAQAATELISSDQQSASHPVVRTVVYFGQQLAQRTKGELTVSVKPDSQLGGEQDALKHVQEGSQAMARVSLGLFAGKVPAADIASLPYLFRSTEHFNKVLAGPFGHRLDDELEKAGFIRVMYLNSGARDFYCKKPLRSREDFSGKRIRILQSAVFEDLIRNLDATPVSIAFNKVTDAFKAGEIDCAEGGIVNYIGAEHNKVAPYFMQDEHMLIPDVLVMSKKVWEKLTPAQREAVKQAGAEGTAYMNQLWKDEEAAAMAAAKRANVTVVPRAQISMTGIESQAIKTYNKFVKSSDDLETVMKIVTAK
jgi:tripartite ATP-independent transporter DctP family solute receptor